MRKFTYFTNVMLPTTKAHGVQIVNTSLKLSKVCKDSGLEFELIINDRKMFGHDIFSFYGLDENQHFNFKRLKIVDLKYPEYIYFWLQYFLFFKNFLKYRNSRNNDIYYTRDWPLSLLLKIFGFKNVFFEAHGNETRWMNKVLYKYISGIVCITQGLKEIYKRYMPEEKILVAHDGVNLDNFDLDISRDEAKEKLRLDNNLKYVMYIGSIGVYDWKGVDTFLEAGRLNTDPGVKFLVVGGTDDEVGKLRSNFPTIDFVGRKQQSDIPLWQKAAHVLVIPNKKGNIVSERYTSPLKLFEYMASGVPIVASDLPSLREVLNEGNSIFFDGSTSESLLNSIRKIFNDYGHFTLKAKVARVDVEKYSYEKRAESIIKFVLNLS